MTINIFPCGCGERTVFFRKGSFVTVEPDCSGGKTCKKTASEFVAEINRMADERDKALAEVERLKAELDEPSRLTYRPFIEADGATASRADTHGIVAYSGGAIYTGGLPEELHKKLLGRNLLSDVCGCDVCIKTDALFAEILAWHESAKARIT